jgi:hypothetical protein
MFNEDGGYDTTWSLGSRLQYAARMRLPIQVDTSDVTWVAYQKPRRPRPTSGPALGLYFALVARDGSVIDTLSPPALPNLSSIPATHRLPGHLTGISVPYHPDWVWGWSPAGRFAIARTDEYRIELLPPPSAPNSDTTVIEWHAPRIPISDAEREEIRDTLLQQSQGLGIDVPKIAAYKPVIGGIGFTEDGRLLVSIHQPSRRLDGRWVEDRVLDVFEADGAYVGRLKLPPLFRISRIRGNRVWAMISDEDGAQYIRRYHIKWK